MRPSQRPSKRPSARPSGPAASYPEPNRSIPPGEPRKRALLAGICATLFGAFLVSAFVRACEGDDGFTTTKEQQQEQVP